MLFGIDLGGTKIEGVVLKSAIEPTVMARLRLPTGAEHGYWHIIHQIVAVVRKLEGEVGEKAQTVGVGTPGTMDPILHTLKNSNTTCLNGMPFQKDLESALGCKTKMANDANCFAVAEANIGIVRDILPNAEVVFGVIMGTGVGGGIVINGKVINGRQGIAGEWGHNFLSEEGGACYCGKIGCTERILAGPWLEEFYFKRSGTKKKLSDIFANLDKDEAALATKVRLIEFFGKGIATIINVLDPDAIVLGGGVGNVDFLYTEGVEEVKKHIFNHRLDTIFLKPKLGDSAGVFGAALL
jgi:fructokinase